MTWVFRSSYWWDAPNQKVCPTPIATKNSQWITRSPDQPCPRLPLSVGLVLPALLLGTPSTSTGHQTSRWKLENTNMTNIRVLSAPSWRLHRLHSTIKCQFISKTSGKFLKMKWIFILKANDVYKKVKKALLSLRLGSKFLSKREIGKSLCWLLVRCRGGRLLCLAEGAESEPRGARSCWTGRDMTPFSHTPPPESTSLTATKLTDVAWVIFGCSPRDRRSLKNITPQASGRVWEFPGPGIVGFKMFSFRVQGKIPANTSVTGHKVLLKEEYKVFNISQTRASYYSKKY